MKAKSLLTLFISFIFFINIKISLSLNETGEIIKGKPYIHTFNITDEQYISLSIKDLDISSLITYYLHFSTYPVNKEDYYMQQIIYSKELNDSKYPNTNTSNQYSFRFSKNANLFTILPNDTNIIYLTIKCNEYPCSFNFEANIEEENALLKLEEDNNFYWYSTNSLSNENKKINTIKFKFPSGRIDDKKYQMTITVINPRDINGDFIEIKGTRESSSSYLVLPKYLIDIGVIYSFNEGDLEEDINGTYTLDITSMENQFVTVIIKSSKIENDDYLSEITPNSIAKYSYFIAKK